MEITGLRCDSGIRCPGVVSTSPHPFGDPVVELAEGEVRFTVAAEGAAGTGNTGLLELVFDAVAHRSGYEIWVMSPDGTGKAAVTRDFSNDAWPAWSPAGVLVVFSRDGVLQVATTDGGAPRPLTHGLFPAWTW